MKASTLLIVGGLAVAGIIAFTANKVIVLKAVFDKMKIWPTNIKNFKISLTEISFSLDFNIQNPTNQNFSVTGASIVRIKRVSAYRNGTFIGVAEVNLTEIDIPANSVVPLQNLPFKISVQSVLDNLATLSDFTVASLMTGLTIEAVVEVLGTDYVIEG